MGSKWVWLVLALVACGGKDEGEELGPICAELDETCDAAEEMGMTGVDDCVAVAHAGDEDECDAQHDDCMAACAMDTTAM
jgi:hypothetical protein